MVKADFCTCTDRAYALHPVNHDKGCTPCIAKNLKENEIPSCFFARVADDAGGLGDYSMENFARLTNIWANKKGR